MKGLEMSKQGKTEVEQRGSLSRLRDAIKAYDVSRLGIALKASVLGAGLGLALAGCGEDRPFGTSRTDGGPKDAQGDVADGMSDALDGGADGVMDAGRDSAVQAACGFDTVRNFLLRIVDGEGGVSNPSPVVEGEELGIKPNDGSNTNHQKYTVGRKADGGLLLHTDSGQIKVDGQTLTGVKFTIDVEDGIATVDTDGDGVEGTIVSDLVEAGVGTVTVKARFEDNVNYSGRAVVKVTAGNNTIIDIVDQGLTLDARDGSDHVSAGVVKAHNGGDDSGAVMATLSENSSGDVANDLEHFAEGSSIVYSNGSVTLVTANDEYNAECRRYLAELTYTNPDTGMTHAPVPIAENVEDAKLVLPNGGVVRVGKVAFKQNRPDLGYIKLTAEAGATFGGNDATTITLLKVGDSVVVRKDGKDVTVTFTGLSFEELIPPV